MAAVFISCRSYRSGSVLFIIVPASVVRDLGIYIDRGVERGGTWVNVPRHGLKKLAPELKTDDCFATGVTRQTLLKPKENVQFQR